MIARGPFHEGEIAVQLKAGERHVALRNGAILRETVAPTARAILAAMRTIAVGAVDDDGRPWASLWLGSPGFATSDDGLVVDIARSADVVSDDDPIRELLRPGRDVGLLGIDLATRRRLRVNGTIVASTDERLGVTVREAFPNCPKYIQRRELVDEPATGSHLPAAAGEELDAGRRAVVARVDTLFVASRHPERGVDVSHRGGERGFVRVVDRRRLRFPDYPGNGMFQTLGNFEVEPRAGVVMVDFDGRRFLSFTGTVTVSYGEEDLGHPSGGTGRYWELAIERWRDFAMPALLRHRLIERSPYNPPAAR